MPRPADRIHATILQGKPLDFLPVIDLHGHLGHYMHSTARLLYDYDMVIREMDLYGIDILVASSTALGGAGSLRRSNDEVLRAIRELPGRIEGYCVLSSTNPDRNLDELRRCYELGIRCGVKMHRYNQPGYRITDRFLEPVLTFLNEKRLIYINHSLGTPQEVAEIAVRYPNITILNGHGGNEHAELGRTYPNVYANSCSMMGPGTVEDLVTRFGATRLTLGSDFSLFQLGWGIGPIASDILISETLS